MGQSLHLMMGTETPLLISEFVCCLTHTMLPCHSHAIPIKMSWFCEGQWMKTNHNKPKPSIGKYFVHLGREQYWRSDQLHCSIPSKMLLVLTSFSNTVKLSRCHLFRYYVKNASCLDSPLHCSAPTDWFKANVLDHSQVIINCKLFVSNVVNAVAHLGWAQNKQT